MLRLVSERENTVPMSRSAPPGATSQLTASVAPLRRPADRRDLKTASWRAHARQGSFLQPLWGGLHARTRPTRAAHTRARVARGASEPTANIAHRAYSCMARWRSSPTNANKWPEASRAFRERRSASHHCRGSMPPRSRDMSRAMHASAAAPKRAHSAFRAAVSVPSSSHGSAAPNERVQNGLVGLAGASASHRRGG